MAHQRKRIRDQVETTLTGLVTTGSNVFVSRVYPFEAADLPGLIIYTPEEESEPASMGGDTERHLSLVVEGHVKATTGTIDDSADTIAEEVEAAIDADRTLNGTALFIYLESTEIEFNAESEKPVAVIKMTFNIEYHT